MKRKKRKNIFGKIIVLSIICLLCCVFYHKYTGLEEYKNEIESLESQIAEQKEYGKELDKTAKEYSSDEYVEKHARKLGLVKPDEKIFRNYNDKK